MTTATKAAAGAKTSARTAALHLAAVEGIPVDDDDNPISYSENKRYAIKDGWLYAVIRGDDGQPAQLKLLMTGTATVSRDARIDDGDGLVARQYTLTICCNKRRHTCTIAARDCATGAALAAALQEAAGPRLQIEPGA